MAIALPPLQVLPALPPPRATALRPVSAADGSTHGGRRPDIDAEALREDELQRLRPAEAQSRSNEAGAGASRQESSAAAAEDEIFRSRGETPSFPGGTAAFLAQLLHQEEPEEEAADPFGDASRAYGRFREERDTRHFVDIRDPIDVKI